LSTVLPRILSVDTTEREQGENNTKMAWKEYYELKNGLYITPNATFTQ